jgi:hypothetical protein
MLWQQRTNQSPHTRLKEFLQLFGALQQLSHASEESASAAAVEDAVVEAQG